MPVLDLGATTSDCNKAIKEEYCVLSLGLFTVLQKNLGYRENWLLVLYLDLKEVFENIKKYTTKKDQI